MALLVGCFFAAFLFVIAAAEYERDDDELDEETEMRGWINALADESKRGHVKRSKYSVSGVRR